MRNSKTKGFTLIELIVVIAIIGVLAAILVPSMLGYVRDAKISQANANAKQVHTACAAALTKLGISNADISAGNKNKVLSITPVIENGKITSIDVEGCTVKVNEKEINTTEAFELFTYLGDGFTGAAKAYINGGNYSVQFAAWGNKIGDLTWANEDEIKAVSSQTQRESAKNGTIYGIYPAPTLGEKKS